MPSFINPFGYELVHCGPCELDEIKPSSISNVEEGVPSSGLTTSLSRRGNCSRVWCRYGEAAAATTGTVAAACKRREDVAVVVKGEVKSLPDNAGG